MREPTWKQLNFLEDLGYRGPEPTTLEIASMAITMLKDEGMTPSSVAVAVKAANRNLYESQYEQQNSRKRSCGCTCLILILGFIVLWLIVLVAAAFVSVEPAA